jgi:hypothetical protein
VQTGSARHTRVLRGVFVVWACCPSSLSAEYQGTWVEGWTTETLPHRVWRTVTAYPSTSNYSWTHVPEGGTQGGSHNASLVLNWLAQESNQSGQWPIQTVASELRQGDQNQPA